MIAYIKGQPFAVPWDPNRLLVATDSGVTYELVVHPSFHDSIKDMTLIGVWVWQVFAEDKQIMYGFSSSEARVLAMRIRDVQGMGPVGSAKLIQVAGPQEVLAAIAAGDSKALARLSSGLGPKRAQSIIAEMREYAQSVSAAGLTPVLQSRANRLINAAAQLGIPVDQQLMLRVLKQNEELDDSNVFSAYMGEV